MTKQTHYLLGCGGHARSIADVILANDSEANIIFVDKAARDGETILGFQVVRDAPPEAGTFVPAIGDNEERARLCKGRRLESVVAATAHVGVGSKLDDGVFVANMVHIGPETTIGTGVIVNTGAIVEHNADVGAFCHIAPRATICGGVHIGMHCLVGAGATIKPNMKICGNAIIGAGAVVVSNLEEPGIYVGCPAKMIVAR